MAATTEAADLTTTAAEVDDVAAEDSLKDERQPEKAKAQDDEVADTPVLSKNQQKKLAKKERFAANKAASKAAEKAAKQADTAKRREEVQQKFAAMTEEERDVWRSERQAKRQNRKSETGEKRLRLQQAVKEGQTIIIDCDFEEQMTENEIKSLCGQLQYCYSANIRAAKPCHLCFTSVKGKIAEQAQHQLSGLENWHITQTSATYMDQYQEQQDSLVYLTADSPNELSSLDPAKKYIIGGIVDRNRHKNICFKKAEAQGIQSARLPIGAYMKLASSQVLTVNHVVEILLSWMELQDWKQAFYKVIPTRKRAIGSANDTPAALANASDAAESKQEVHDIQHVHEGSEAQERVNDASQEVTDDVTAAEAQILQTAAVADADMAATCKGINIRKAVTDDDEPASKRSKS